MNRILLVEDEENVAAPLRSYLEREGYAVDHARDLAEAERLLASGPELVLLDWMLPDGQGIELVRKARAAGLGVPILMLTARADLVDKVVGLELGANDYVTKPFEPRELVARIRVQLRGAVPRGPVAQAAGVEIDPVAREARFEGRPVPLTKTEFDLLKLLVEHPGQVFSREELLKKVWGYESYPTTRTVDTHVLQLRSKFRPELFETIHGVGYRFTKSLPSPDNSRKAGR